MASVFGLHPWDIRRLTVAELEQYHAHIDALLTKSEEA